jgi:hypothetical protein
MIVSSPPTPLTSLAKSALKNTDILGEAFFDVNGLPREYFVTA